MTFDQQFATAAIVFQIISFFLWRAGSRRMPDAPGPLSKTLLKEYIDLRFSELIIIGGIILTLIGQVLFWEVLPTAGKWSVAWKCYSALTGLIFVLAVAFYESVRSFNRMRQ